MMLPKTVSRPNERLASRDGFTFLMSASEHVMVYVFILSVTKRQVLQGKLRNRSSIFG